MITTRHSFKMEQFKLKTNNNNLNSNANETDPFCDCKFPNTIQVNNCKGNINDLVDCNCVLNENRGFDWLWDKSNIDSIDNIISDNEITFHPVYSQGTSIIRGEKKLEPKAIHYWEIQVVTYPTGTDLMFGIGTDNIDLNQYKFEFTSGLGQNSESYGYSYRGQKLHKGLHSAYGKTITQGCVIGVYLDLYHGILKFYLNRKSLGIAFSHIPINKNYYPMVTATSSRAAIRLCNSTSVKYSLQFTATKSLIKNKQQSEIEKIPGLKTLISKYWFLFPLKRYSYRSKKNELPIEDEVVLSKRLKKQKIIDTYEIKGLNDLYNNMQIPIKEEDDENDECMYYLF